MAGSVSMQKRFSEFVDWAVIVFLALIVLQNVGCGDSKPPTPPPPAGIHAQSPAGVSVRAEDGLAPDPVLLAKLDADAQRVFDRLTELGKAGFPTHRGITVNIVPRRTECEEPACCFIEESCERVSNCEVYDGGIYDKDKERNGRIKLCASGQFLESSDTILVSRDGVMNGDDFHSEVEHWVLYHFDRAWYLRTRDHFGLDSAHPIF
jgi:hypothetical protein